MTLLINTKNCTYNKLSKSFVTEASDVGYGSQSVIELRSHVSGKVILLKMLGARRDQDHDIIEWIFKPILPSMDFSLRVLND